LKAPENERSEKTKIQFEEYFLKQNHQDISLPYIQSSNSASTKPNPLINNKDIKWSPSKHGGNKRIALLLMNLKF